MVGCAVFALPPAICADDGRFLDQLLGSSCCGGVQSCLSQLFLHYPIFQNHKQGFDLQSKPPHGRMVLMGLDRVQKFTRCE